MRQADSERVIRSKVERGLRGERLGLWSLGSRCKEGEGRMMSDWWKITKRKKAKASQNQRPQTGGLLDGRALYDGLKLGLNWNPMDKWVNGLKNTYFAQLVNPC